MRSIECNVVITCYCVYNDLSTFYSLHWIIIIILTVLYKMHNMYKQEWRRLVMCHWCAFFAGEKAKLEAERERLVHMKELETQKQQAEELRHLVMEVLFQPVGYELFSNSMNGLWSLWIVQGKERIARALDGMGCRRTRVVLTEPLQRSFRNAKRKRRETFKFRHLCRDILNPAANSSASNRGFSLPGGLSMTKSSWIKCIVWSTTSRCSNTLSALERKSMLIGLSNPLYR